MRHVIIAFMLLLAACASPTDTIVGPPSAPVAPTGSGLSLPDGAPIPTELFAGLDHLRTGLRQQQNWQLWDLVPASVATARQDLNAARDDGASGLLVEAGLITAEALATWNGLYLESLGVDRSDPAAALRNADLAARLTALLDDLSAVEGRLAQTSYLLADVQFLAGDAEAGTLTLRYALEKWPGDDDLHELTQAWRDVMHDPDTLIEALDRAAARHSSDGGIRARTLATRAHLSLSMGNTDYAEGRLLMAAERYRSAADDFQEAYVSQFTLSRDEADLLAAQGYTYSGWAEFHLADQAFEDGKLELCRQHLSEAGENFALALGRVPGDEDATRGIDFTGDFFVSPAKLGDMQTGAEFFGDMARRFDHGIWWNNTAFFLRETAPNDDPDVAQAQYEASYSAYERCITLEPDNARFVNDTALILVHYINPLSEERAARAEELLKRAWELGKQVCDNPFTSDAKHQEYFEAYGDAMFNLAVLYARQGRLEEAEKVIDELIEVAPQRPDARQLKQSLTSQSP